MASSGRLIKSPRRASRASRSASGTSRGHCQGDMFARPRLCSSWPPAISRTFTRRFTPTPDLRKAAGIGYQAVEDRRDARRIVLELLVLLGRQDQRIRPNLPDPADDLLKTLRVPNLDHFSEELHTPPSLRSLDDRGNRLPGNVAAQDQDLRSVEIRRIHEFSETDVGAVDVRREENAE